MTYRPATSPKNAPSPNLTVARLLTLIAPGRLRELAATMTHLGADAAELPDSLLREALAGPTGPTPRELIGAMSDDELVIAAALVGVGADGGREALSQRLQKYC